MNHDKTAVRTDMTMDRAREVLGVPPGASDREIKINYRDLAQKYHPDKPGTGDEAKFKEIGIALGVLDGTITPRYDYRPSDPSDPSPPVERQPPRPQQPDKETLFEEAKSKAGIPSGVDWLFVTPSQHSGASYSSDEFHRSDNMFVAYGRTASQHVFVAAHHLVYKQMFIGGGPGEDTWTLRSFEYPIKADEGMNPAWLYGNVVRALKAGGFGGKFNSKVVDAKDWKFTDRLPHGAEVSIKHWLVNSGQVASDAPSVAGRKQVVEFHVSSTMMGPKPGYFQNPKSTYNRDYYKLTLVINGRPFDLDESDTMTFFTGFKGGLRTIFGEYYYQGSKKTLTRMPKGKPILTWMAENLKGLPAEAQTALQAAAAQMK
jgi:hypothetical protein